jgi:Tfp pilus assembly protein PilV
MLHLICNKKGISMVEMVIAIFLTSVAVLSLLSLQPSGWRYMAKADYMGRAAEILHSTLEAYETNISNPCNSVTTGAQTQASITTSGSGTAIKGDIRYTVDANITQTNADPQTFVVTVTITWTGNTTGISESMAITRQESYKFGC